MAEITTLYQYVATDEGYFALYEQSQIDEKLVAKIQALLPKAHVVTMSRYSCKDCIRNVPRMARIADALPAWTWEIVPNSDEERKQALNIIRVPTFIVFDREDGRELGRISENPDSGSLEQDLLEIARAEKIRPSRRRAG